ncbi:MAG: hypothetical protein ACI9FJ_001028 [Alteromonadaceae bacterium]|jgi:hypothetical protein
MSNQRNSLTLIALPGKNMFHFCSTELKGINNEAWYPYAPDQLFEYVERLLTCAQIAANVVGLTELRQCGDSVDYEVIFNRPALSTNEPDLLLHDKIHYLADADFMDLQPCDQVEMVEGSLFEACQDIAAYQPLSESIALLHKQGFTKLAANLVRIHNQSRAHDHFKQRL